MKIHAVFFLAVTFLLEVQSGQAAVNCTVSSSGISAAYSGALSINQTSVIINCTRLPDDPATSAYNISPDNGINASGQFNRAMNGAYHLAYEEFQDSICSTSWQTPGASMNGTIDFGSALGVTVTRDYWACIPGDQVQAVGSYSDTVLMTLTYDDGTTDVTSTGGHQVMILTTPSCSISTAPGHISFSYTALQNTTSTTNTIFGTTCSAGTGYSISLDSDEGVISGLQYSLRINTSDNSGSNPLGSSGTGIEQNFYINGTMPANQAGSCSTASCQDSAVHTLLITY